MKKILVIIICFGLFSTIAYGRQSKADNRRTTLRNSKKSVSKASKKPVFKLSPLKKKEVTIISSSELQIFDLEVHLPGGNNGNTRLPFKLRNNTDQDMAAKANKYYVYRRHQGGDWVKAFSCSLPEIGAKQTISINSHAELSLLDKEVQIVIYEDDNIAKPIITQATANTNMPSVSSVQIKSVMTDANNWEVVVWNNCQHYLWNVLVQTCKGSGGTWTASGGKTIESIAPGESGTAVMPKPVGWKSGYSQFKVALYQANDTLMEQIYSLQD